MKKIDFFKQQSKRLLNDYKTRKYNQEEDFYEYNPQHFFDIEDIVNHFKIESQKDFTLMNAQHIVAKLAGFYKWNDLIAASEAKLDIGRLLIINRDKYQKTQGFFTSGLEINLIVDDWKTLENNLLVDYTDEDKLDFFRKEFLSNKSSNYIANKIVIDLKGMPHVQDMIKTIMNEKNLAAGKAVSSSITHKNFVRIVDTGYGDIAISLWGHDNPYKKYERLENQVIEIKLSNEKKYLLETIMKNQRLSLVDAISHFVIFNLESLGYHI